VMQNSQNAAWTHRTLEKANDDEGTTNVASQETQTQAERRGTCKPQAKRRREKSHVVVWIQFYFWVSFVPLT